MATQEVSREVRGCAGYYGISDDHPRLNIKQADGNKAGKVVRKKIMQRREGDGAVPSKGLFKTMKASMPIDFSPTDTSSDELVVSREGHAIETISLWRLLGARKPILEKK